MSSVQKQWNKATNDLAAVLLFRWVSCRVGVCARITSSLDFWWQVSCCYNLHMGLISAREAQSRAPVQLDGRPSTPILFLPLASICMWAAFDPQPLDQTLAWVEGYTVRSDAGPRGQ